LQAKAIPAKAGIGFASGIAQEKSPIPAKVGTGFASGIALGKELDHRLHSVEN
jgi:hypothetical protein